MGLGSGVEVGLWPLLMALPTLPRMLHDPQFLVRRDLMWTLPSSQPAPVQTPFPRPLAISHHLHHLKWGMYQATHPPHHLRPHVALIWTWAMNLRALLHQLHLT